MAKIHSLKLLLKDIEQPLILQVNEEECERLKSILGRLSLDGSSIKFFNFSTLDGRFYSINLKYLQAVNYLWDASPLALDRTRYEGSINIYLLNRQLAVETYTESPIEIYDFFCGLESDNGLSFLGFTDNDGELLSFQCNEIIYALTPEHIYEEGESKVNQEDLAL